MGWAVALAIKNFIRDDGSALAGYMAYTALLCLFPFLIFATALCGLLIGPEGVEPVMNFLFANIPEHVAKTIRPVLEEVVRNRSSNVLSLSALGAIWIASNGFEALRTGLERAYMVRNYRSWWANRLISIGFVFIALVAFFALAVLIVLGPSLIALANEFTGALRAVEEFLGVDLKIWVSFRYIFGLDGAGECLLDLFPLRAELCHYLRRSRGCYRDPLVFLCFCRNFHLWCRDQCGDMG